MTNAVSKIISCLCLTLALAASLASAETPALPLADGEYIFTHRDGEHPHIETVQVRTIIKDGYITIINETKVPEDAFIRLPLGVLAEGLLRLHPASGKWMIGGSEEDAEREEIGGCADGPQVVDLEKRIYWTC